MAALTAAELEREAIAAGLQCRQLEAVPSSIVGNFHSLCFLLEGDTAAALASSWVGSVQWVWQSTYRPGHKRKNWYVKVTELEPELSLPKQAQLDLRDVKFESMHASGAGGQHVNKTDSAVRATHLPTGKSAYSQEARSQHMNKKLALAKLAMLFEADIQLAEAAEQAVRRLNHYTIERGEAATSRVYDAATMKRKK
jgi:peptide chain release factor